MSDADLPEMADLWEIVEMFLSFEEGKLFANTVRQTFAYPVNNLPLPEIIVIAQMRGGLNIVAKPTLDRICSTYGVNDTDTILTFRGAQRALGLNDDEYAELRLKADRRVRTLLSNAIDTVTNNMNARERKFYGV